MRKFIFSLLMTLPIAAFSVNPNKTLLVVDGQTVSVGEFQYIYGKNNSGTAIDKRSLEEYKDLFINFKLKVAEAERQGLDTTEAFIMELKGYRNQLAMPYMTSKHAQDSLLKEAYSRRLVNRDIWHIAIRAPRDASPEDTLAAYQKAWNTYHRLKGIRINNSKQGRQTVRAKVEPAPFELVADQVSDDPSVKDNHGHLGWVGVFQMLYDFENACYNTPVGGISTPVRTYFGYHIIKVAAERPDPGEWHAAHIMLFTRKHNDNETAAEHNEVDSINNTAKNRIDSIYTRLEAGDDFAELANKYSEDRGTSFRGGDLGKFATGVINEFEEALLALPEGKEFTKPIRTKYGWHILRRISHRNWGTFDDEKKTLNEVLNRSDRQQYISEYFLDSLRTIYGAQGNDSITDQMLITRYDSELESRFADFHNLMQEYHDGILLFDISNREVWDKASQDTAGLQKFFLENKGNYQWHQPHFRGRLIYCRDKATLKMAKTMAKNAVADSLDRYLNARLNDSIQYVRIHRVLADPEDTLLTGNKILHKTVFKKAPKQGKKYLKVFNNDGSGHYSIEGYPYVIITGYMANEPEKYTDMRGPVTADYQEYLEKTWIEKLRREHVWNLDPKVWEEIKGQ
ncbi:MAG: peptidylprolyl isomerase [Paludibacteraceae bacterium]|nr:peptidylprolyl isomerase [Paludibacteraceae bacterium]